MDGKRDFLGNTYTFDNWCILFTNDKFKCYKLFINFNFRINGTCTNRIKLFIDNSI